MGNDVPTPWVINYLTKVHSMKSLLLSCWSEVYKESQTVQANKVRPYCCTLYFLDTGLEGISGSWLESLLPRVRSHHVTKCCTSCQGSGTVCNPTHVWSQNHKNDRDEKISTMLYLWDLCFGATNSYLIKPKFCPMGGNSYLVL